MARRRGGRRRRGSTAGADVLAVERGGSAAPEAAADAATPSRRRKRRRPRRRRGRSAGGAAGAADASEQTEAPVSDAISTQAGSDPQASCHLEGVPAHLSYSETATWKIMNSNETEQKAGNKALKLSVADDAACSSLPHGEYSVGETEASRSKVFERSSGRFPTDNCTAQGIDGTNMDYHNMDPNSPEMKGTVSRNQEEVHRNRICPGYSSSQKSEEYEENENGVSLSSSSLKEEKKRIRKRRGEKRHNCCKKTVSQDLPLPNAADNSGFMTIVSEDNTSGLQPKEQRKKEGQNKVPIASLVPVDNERSAVYGVNMDGTAGLGTSNLDGTIELGMSNLGSSYEKRFELGESSLDCTNMERNGLQEQDVPCKSNHHDANYLRPFCLVETYLDGTIKKRCGLGTSNVDSAFEKRCELGGSSLDFRNMERTGFQEQGIPCKSYYHNANYQSPSCLAEAESSLDSTNMKRNGLLQEVPFRSNDHNAYYLNPYHSAEAYREKFRPDFFLGRPLWFPKKKLLILDLNGLLADINEDYHNAHMADAKVRRKLVFRRPYCDDFLYFCALNFELGVWSSRKKENVASVVDIVMRDFKSCLRFCWDMSKCTFTGHKTLENMHKPLMLKELRKLWNKEEPDLPWEQGDYSPSNTLLVDDSPYKALRNPPHTAIFPHSYSYLNWNDNSLGPGGDLRVYLQHLAAADDVQCFVRNYPFGQPFITESDPHWNFYAQIAHKGSAPMTCFS
ncbi:hypothetical protein U9M48_010589 [Paspalum notatum var. saurae]|uniref:FCP1 homology domain-containing protein n=1 Tax=Paspalum notatum var. saurae TaxID=547442 RepID=A0AAQ3STZ1_PASNO